MENGALTGVLLALILVFGVVSGLLAIFTWKLIGKTRQDAPGSKISKVVGSSIEDLSPAELTRKVRMLELEWEDTRAKFLGMTRSFIRQAKAAGFDGSGEEPPEEAKPMTPTTRAGVLQEWRRRNANQ